MKEAEALVLLKETEFTQRLQVQFTQRLQVPSVSLFRRPQSTLSWSHPEPPPSLQEMASASENEQARAVQKQVSI